MDTREKPRIVPFLSMQGVKLNAAEHLVPVRKNSIHDDVKQDCIQLGQKYLFETAKRFYASLPESSDLDIMTMMTETFSP